MKLTDVDIEDDDIRTMNKRDRFDKELSIEDTKLSFDVPIVVHYDYIDTGDTPYNFMQQFTHEDTKGYFSKMREFAGKSINKLTEFSCEHHFYRSEMKGNVKKAIRSILPKAVGTDQIIYHFCLYDGKGRTANRESGVRDSRVYFMLGTYGHIYILFFDPYHELNPIAG